MASQKSARRSGKVLGKTKKANIRRSAIGKADAKGKVSAKKRLATQPGVFASLRPNVANFTPLTPLSFLHRAADIHPDRTAVIHGERRTSYREFYQRAKRLASALKQAGVKPGDTVSVMLPNVPAMLEAHYGVPMLGAVLNTINTRLEAATVAYILQHGEAKVLITDRELAGQVGPALAQLKRKPLVIDVVDALYTGPGQRLGSIEYEDFIAKGDPDFQWSPPANESSAIALNYTSGTTGNPKGVVYHHRGTFLEAARQHHVMAAAGKARLSMDAADVPLQRLVLPLVRDGDGRHACLFTQSRSGLDLPDDRRARRHPYVRRTDRPRDADIGAGRTATQVQPYRRHPDRRFATARQDHQGDGRTRLPRHPYLRHDRIAGAVDTVRATGRLGGAAAGGARRAQRAPRRALCRGGRPDGRGPAQHEAGAARRQDHGRDHDPRQHGDARLSEGAEGDLRCIPRWLDAYR